MKLGLIRRFTENGKVPGAGDANIDALTYLPNNGYGFAVDKDRISGQAGGCGHIPRQY